MSECPDCDVMRKKSTGKELFACVLCGEKRCADHTIWLPAHELEKYSEEVTRIKEILRGDPQAGWYAFCGKGTHIPRGLPIRYGKNKEGGRLVQSISSEYKKKGLEFFKWWEVGIIENSLEKWWDTDHYALSCSLAPAMVLMAHLILKGDQSENTRIHIYEKVVAGIASKKEFFEVPPKDAFQSFIQKESTTQEYAAAICSFCGIIPCLNRLKLYFDQKRFKKMIKDATL